MVSKLRKAKKKTIAILLIALVVIGVLVGGIYSSTNNHYAIDVVKENASNSNDSLQVSEKIVKGENEEFFDSKELDYELELKNIGETENVENQVAIVLDTSYSMEVNDTNTVLKNTAIELATGILSNVKNSRISISSNSNTKIAMSSPNETTITDTVNAIAFGEGNNSNQGLENGKNTFINPINAENKINKYMIVFTDSTDHVAEKMKEITKNDPSIKIISILVDMTSNSYIIDNTPICGNVYLLLSEVTEENVSEDIELLNLQKIYDTMNNLVENIVVVNEFSDAIQTYFDIDYNEEEIDGTIKTTSTGYEWNVDKLLDKESATLKFTLKLKTDVDIDTSIIFNELYTNKTQDIKYNSVETLEGTDSRDETNATVIKICQGYDLKIKAVNEKNTELEGIDFKVVGIKDETEEVCNITKTTDSEGYITITTEEARALRMDGTITYTVIPTVNKVGYAETDSVSFDIANDKITKTLIFDDHDSNLEYTIKEKDRNVEVKIPINRVHSTEGTTKIRKYKTGTDIVLQGAEIALYDEEGNVLKDSEGKEITLTTNANGEVGIPSLEYGTYKYKEIEAPDGYILNETMYSFSVNADGTITFLGDADGNNATGIIYDDIVCSVEGSTKIKKCKTGTDMGLQGAVIGLYNEEGSPLEDGEGNTITLTTNENGEAGIPSLEYGTYKYKEIKAPEGYILNETMYSFSVNADGTISFLGDVDGNNANGIIYNDEEEIPEIPDNPITANVKITKYETGTKEKIAGAVIGLYDEEGNAILDKNGNKVKLRTDENGEVEFTELEVGIYQYKEIQAPEGYVINETMYKFKINADGTVTFLGDKDGNNANGIIYNDKEEIPEIPDSPITANVKITKYETGTEEKVAGAVIVLYDKTGKVIVDNNGNKAILITDENGEVEFTELEVGIYQYKEIQAPEGYVLNETIYKFTVNEDGTVTFLGDNDGNNADGIIYNDKEKMPEIPDDPVTANAKISIYETGTEERVAGAVIGLYNEEGAPLQDSEGNTITLTTNINGEVGIPSLEVGTYQYREIEVPKRYILNETMYSFTVNEDGTVTFLGDNDGNNADGIIYNDKEKNPEIPDIPDIPEIPDTPDNPITANVKITKYETGTKEKIAGAVIGLYDKEGNAILDKNGNKVRLITDENGEVEFIELEVGTYEYKEIQAPEGYILNETIYKFKVNEDGTVTFLGDKDGNNADGIIYNDKEEIPDNPEKPEKPDIPNEPNNPNNPNNPAQPGNSNNNGDTNINNNSGEKNNGNLNNGNNENNGNYINNSNTNKGNITNTPYTGDILPLITTGIVLLVLMTNIIISSIKIKQKKNK